MGQFAIDLAKFAKLAGENAELVVKKVAVDMLSSVVRRSPVDTGRFRGNWQLTIGAPAVSKLTRDDPKPLGSNPGSEVANEAQAALLSYQFGQDIYIVNNLPYANRLEYEGYSKQAPNGMVRVTVAEFQQKINKAVSELPK